MKTLLQERDELKLQMKALRQKNRLLQKREDAVVKLVHMLNGTANELNDPTADALDDYNRLSKLFKDTPPKKKLKP